MQRKIFLPVLALGLATGSLALAQEQTEETAPAPDTMMEDGMDGPGGRMLGHMDTDGDGSISSEEFSNTRLEPLRAADSDGDGTLSMEELQDYVLQREVERKARRTAAFLDIDSDGEVTIAELEDQRSKRFALMDTNEDGALDAREMRRGFHEMMGGRKGHHEGHHMGMMRMHRMAPPADASPDEDEE